MDLIKRKKKLDHDSVLVNKGEWIEKNKHFMYSRFLLSQISFFQIRSFNTMLRSDFGISDFWKSQECCICIHQLLLFALMELLLIAIVVRCRCWLWITWFHTCFLYLPFLKAASYWKSAHHYGTYIGAVLCKCWLWIIPFYHTYYIHFLHFNGGD